MTTLVIVESPGKVKKISALLGAGYKVVASVGHVRDLPPKELGIEPPDFRPHYQPTERGRDVLARLKKDVAAADRVLLATDPDREGEAIAWHLADALKLREPQRITFTAITKDKVQAAVADPRAITDRLLEQLPALFVELAGGGGELAALGLVVKDDVDHPRDRIRAILRGGAVSLSGGGVKRVPLGVRRIQRAKGGNGICREHRCALV